MQERRHSDHGGGDCSDTVASQGRLQPSDTDGDLRASTIMREDMSAAMATRFAVICYGSHRKLMYIIHYGTAEGQLWDSESKRESKTR